jgi:large repetitive protein
LAASGTLSFAPGETSRSVTVSVTGDPVPEPDEAFLLHLSAPTNATLADGQGQGTIVNDDQGVPATVQAVPGYDNTASYNVFQGGGELYDPPMQARVLDQSGAPVAGVHVRFEAPTSGPSVSFQGTNSPVFDATTEANGVATAPARATFTPGTFAVLARLPEYPSVPAAFFQLTNT